MSNPTIVVKGFVVKIIDGDKKPKQTGRMCQSQTAAHDLRNLHIKNGQNAFVEAVYGVEGGKRG